MNRLIILAALLLPAAPALADNVPEDAGLVEPEVHNPLTTDLNLNGKSLTCTPQAADTAAPEVFITPPKPWSGASVNTSGGWLSVPATPGTTQFTFKDGAETQCSTDALTLVVNGTTITLTEGTHWNRGASKAAACASAAAAWEAQTGVTATCVSATVRISAESGAYEIKTAGCSDTTNCATVVNGTEGGLKVRGLQVICTGDCPTWGHSSARLRVEGDVELDGNVYADNVLYGTIVGSVSGVNVSVGAGAFSFGSPGTISVVAADGISSALAQARSMSYISGSGGAVDVTANPQIGAGSTGEHLWLICTSDTNTVKWDDGNGLTLAGGASFTMGALDVLHLWYSTSGWIELGRVDN